VKQPITLPALSDTMLTGRLVRWLKQVGDPVKTGDALAEVETDKATMEVEAFHDGFLAGPLAPVDTDIPVRETIAFIADSAADAGTAQGKSQAPTKPETSVLPKAEQSPPLAAKPAPPSGQAKAPVETAHPSHPASPASSNVRASPYARSLARDLDVDLATVRPGQDGTVHPAEIVRAFRQPPLPDLDAGPPYRVERLSSMREAMARNMIASLATPTFRVTAQFPIESLKKAADAKRLSLTLLIARACALTIKANPIFNAVYTPKGLARRERVDVAIAVDVPDGLITPVLRDAAERPLAKLADDWRALSDKVKNRRLKPEEYQGGTFYVSNLGMFPTVHNFDAVLPLGAAAILCIGAGTGGRASFTVNCDHRVVSGADGARFLQALSEQFSDPQRLSS
jgi:pyruvate dehydrogenase E2 component (dihydrolipoyllysine-residue acetyltransferase)